MSKLMSMINRGFDFLHDSIWDIQSWVADLIGKNIDGIKANARALHFNRWAPYHLLAIAGRSLLVPVSVVNAAIVTIMSIALSVSLDSVRAAVNAFSFAIATIASGFSSLKKLFSRKKKQVELQEVQVEENAEQCTVEFDTDSNWYKILEYSRFAPSPHNMQPWLFELESEDTATLLYDPQRLLPGTNPNGSFMFVGFGVLMETMSIAAAPLGLDVNAKYFESELDPDAVGPQRLATLRLQRREQNEDLNPQLILDRQTSRLPYNGVPLAQEALDELSEVAVRYGHKMEFSSHQPEVNWVVDLNAKTMFYDMSKASARNEVGSWMRFSKSDAVKRADGLAAYAMNVPGWQMWLFSHVNWFFRIPGISNLVHRAYKKTMSGTATVSWLSGPFSNRDEWLNAGRMMARWWLTMTKHKIYLHPFGSVITNEKANAQMTSHFASEERAHDLWMLARLGHGEKPPAAQRFPLDKMVLKTSKFGLFTESALAARDGVSLQNVEGVLEEVNETTPLYMRN